MQTNAGADDPSVPPHLVPSRVLARLAESCRSDFESASLAHRLEQAGPPDDDPDGSESLEWLARVGDDLGLRSTLLRLDPKEAADLVESGGYPLTNFDPRTGVWLTLIAVRGRKVHVLEQGPEDLEAPREAWLSRRKLAARIQAPGEGLPHWLAVAPISPHQAAVSGSTDTPPLKPFARLVRLLAPERGDILAVVAFSIAVGILLLATPIAVQSLVNSIALGGVLQPLVVVTLLLLLALSFAATLTAVETWVVELIQRRLFVRAVSDLTSRLPRVRIDAYERVDGGELVNRFFDVITIQKVTAKLLIDALAVVLSILVGLTVLAFYHPLLLAFDIILLGIIAIVVFAPLRRGERTAIAESSSKYAVQAWIEEIARNPFTFKHAGAQQWVHQRADALSRTWVEGRRSHFRTLYSQVTGALGLQVVASTTLLGIGGWLVIQGSLTLGQLVAAELIVSTVVVSVAKMGKYLEDWYDLMAAVHKVGQMLDLPVEDYGGEHPAETSEGPGCKLEIHDLEWTHGHGATYFGGLSHRVNPGERVGIRGSAGSGKSTLLELFWRLREPSQGWIRLDGRNLRDLAPSFLRREIALASPLEIVHGSLRDNVKLGRAFISNDDVRSALERVGLLDTIAELPEGLDTVIRPTNPHLADGQLRQLALARAIAGKPRLLLVDDLCDHVTRDVREHMLKTLLDPEAPWTLVLVSDRPDVLERCDAVIDLPSATKPLEHSTTP